MTGVVLLAAMVRLASAVNASTTSAETITVHPERDDTMLLNPGKGWVQYYGADKYTKDYIGIGYTRWAWSVLEPKEGQYNWKEIDGFLAQFKRYGKKTAFGVMSVSTGLGQYVTPKWVFEAGAVPLAVPDDSSPTGQQIIPKTWDDPVFLKKLKAFVRALGQHYDGNPDIAFLDIRSYGNWGEGHIGMLNHLSEYFSRKYSLICFDLIVFYAKGSSPVSKKTSVPIRIQLYRKPHLQIKASTCEDKKVTRSYQNDGDRSCNDRFP